MTRPTPSVVHSDQAKRWWSIRENADEYFDRGDRYIIAVAGERHEVATMSELARLTINERRQQGVRWPEDGK